MILNSIPKPKRNPSSAFKKISPAPIKVSEHDKLVIDEKETINMKSVYPDVDNFILSNEQKIEWVKGFQILKGFE